MKTKSLLFYLLKMLEVILAACCIGLMYSPIRRISVTRRERASVWMVAFGSTLFVSLTLLISRALEGSMRKVALFLFIMCNAILNCAGGGLILKDWDDYDSEYIVVWKRKYLNMMLSAGILAIFNTLVHIIDISIILFAK